jgi:hypothetical protein
MSQKIERAHFEEDRGFYKKTKGRIQMKSKLHMTLIKTNNK